MPWSTMPINHKIPVLTALQAGSLPTHAHGFPPSLLADPCENVDCTSTDLICVEVPGTCVNGDCQFARAPEGTDCGGGKKCNANGNCAGAEAGAIAARRGT